MKNVLITGASRGIGASIAVAFAKKGYNILLNYEKSDDTAQKLCTIIEDTYSVKALKYKADVSDYDQVKKMSTFAFENFGHLDVLVNNAGISLIKLITDTTKEEWDRVISVNLTSMFNTVNTILPDMIKNHRGCIINVSSMWGESGASCEVAYSAAKAGVIGFTKALAKEVGPSDIRVNCISPGVIMTDMNDELDDDTIEALKNETALNRLGTPKNIADTAVFLASDSASYITGQVLGINGGILT